MQQITPTVSVAVITYNMQQYLPQLLDSILMQKTNFPFEIVVDDDHSPDQSRTILLDYQRCFPDRIVLSLRDRNVGGSLNMYGVLRQCRGKYIAILEGDTGGSVKTNSNTNMIFWNRIQSISRCTATVG